MPIFLFKLVIGKLRNKSLKYIKHTMVKVFISQCRISRPEMFHEKVLQNSQGNTCNKVIFLVK